MANDELVNSILQFNSNVKYFVDDTSANVKPPEPKAQPVKVTLPEPHKTIAQIDRRVAGQGNLTESFPETQASASNSRRERSYTKALDGAVSSLAKYQSVADKLAAHLKLNK